MPARRLARLLRERKVSATELMQALQRAKAFDRSKRKLCLGVCPSPTIQIVGRHRADVAVLQLAHAFEGETQAWKRRPAVLL